MTSRHEFLEQLHLLVKPKVYLEVGVQYGWSLRLAHAAEVAIGIDPAPLVAPAGNQVIFTMTSDEYFAHLDLYEPRDPVDLAFIDGMHLFEYAVTDFINILKVSHPNTIVVFDDVLPRNQGMAAREQCPGDWTGDVWKVRGVLKTIYPDIRTLLVDTQPTGTMVAWDLWQIPEAVYPDEFGKWHSISEVPADILLRTHAVDPQLALHMISEYLQAREQV